eukprot:CAMPEP_0180148514 /NCGR_PEP_ID=MMETSP0986-20121125/20035_1 /TAXON_ID=697907 /ORGANISM="non described non described, Strain CCMP2293" /LENGTH=61 /DNA_ID=CAMNT_0022094545 /DNA_START=19 /DNA_END=204 /DNA_ORIENTATION=-
MANNIRAMQAHYGKFHASIHRIGPGDSITNMIVAGFISSGLFLSSYNIYCLMGNGKKMEGR